MSEREAGVLSAGQTERRLLAEREFALQSRDSNWAAAAERHFDLSVRGLSDGASLADVECRATLCRLSIRADREDAALEYVQQIRRGAVGFGPGFLARDDDGGVTVWIAKGASAHPPEGQQEVLGTKGGNQ